MPRAANSSIPANSIANAANDATNARPPYEYPYPATVANTIIPTHNTPQTPSMGIGPIWRVADKRVLYRNVPQ